MPVTLVKSYWESGSLVFDGGNGKVLTIGPNGLSTVITALPVGDAYSGIRSVVTAAAASNAYGTAGYFETTLTGTVASTVYGFGSWINMGVSAVGGSNLICAQDNGIYLASTELANATCIIGMRMEYISVAGSNPGALYLFSTNIYDNALTAMFHVNAAVDVAWVTGAKTGGAGNIPLFRDVSASVTWYVNVYSS